MKETIYEKYIKDSMENFLSSLEYSPGIKYSNKHWQVMELPKATVFLYAAYLDTRKDFSQINFIQKYFFYRTLLPVIRIMAFVKGEIQEKK